MGDQLIEPKSLENFVGRTGSNEVTAALLTFLVERAGVELADKLDGATLAVVRAEYHGAYLSIGLTYPSGETDEPPLVEVLEGRLVNLGYSSPQRDLGPVVEECINRLVSTIRLEEVLEFVAHGRRNWGEVSDTLMGRR